MNYKKWEYIVKQDEEAIVYPDGCRDVIFVCSPYKFSDIRYTQWDHKPRRVELKAGTRLSGYRLCPGLTVAEKAVVNSFLEPKLLEDFIESEIVSDCEINEVIHKLTLPHAMIENMARQCGVVPRTLQLRFHDLSLPSPDFWRKLGRARRALQALPYSAVLSEIAYEYGYSDQAHMTREFVRWFGKTPAKLLQSKSLFDDMIRPGLGNWVTTDA